MNDPIPGGGFIVARKLFHSRIWMKPPLFLKTWIWIIGQASHANHSKGNRKYKRGEFLTTYDTIIKSLSYRFNRQHVTPTLKQVRIILKWLESEGMIIVKAIRDSERPTGADPRARTRAYIGVKVLVVNYNTYQVSKNYKGRHKGRPSVQLGHDNNNGYNNGNNISVDLYTFYLQKIDPKEKTRQRALSNISHHLKKHSAEDLKQAISNYKTIASTREPKFRKNPANFFGKREPYFIDFLPKNFVDESNQDSTGSALLDSYYANSN